MLNCYFYWIIITGGPAALAGVQKGDSIIKVNGTQVSKVNHKQVVQIIKCKLLKFFFLY